MSLVLIFCIRYTRNLLDLFKTINLNFPGVFSKHLNFSKILLHF